MNRRGFLKLAATAPVAAPIAVKSALASQPWASGGMFTGIDGAALIDPDSISIGYTPAYEYCDPELRFFERLRGGDFRRCGGTARTFRFSFGDPSVEEQMIEHDLFDLDGGKA